MQRLCSVKSIHDITSLYKLKASSVLVFVLSSSPCYCALCWETFSGGSFHIEEVSVLFVVQHFPNGHI